MEKENEEKGCYKNPASRHHLPVACIELLFNDILLLAKVIGKPHSQSNVSIFALPKLGGLNPCLGNVQKHIFWVGSSLTWIRSSIDNTSCTWIPPRKHPKRELTTRSERCRKVFKGKGQSDHVNIY